MERLGSKAENCSRKVAVRKLLGKRWLGKYGSRWLGNDV